MSSIAPGNAARSNARVFVVLAALAAVLAFQPIRFAIDRLYTAAPDSSPGAGIGPPWFALFASGVLTILAIGFALVAWLRWTRTEAALDSLVTTAARLAIGERGLRARPRSPVLEPLAGALNRLGALNESAEQMLLDRERQLAVVRRHARAAYWETDRDGRLQRIEYEPTWPNAERCAWVGAAHLENAGALDPQAWQAALEALAARQAYEGLVLERTSAEGRPIRVIESGEPRFGADGDFLGYCGTMRRIDPDSTLRQTALRTAFETSPRPVFVVACAPWPLPIVWMNASGRALLGGNGPRDVQPTIGALLEASDGEAVRELQQAILRRSPLRRALQVRDRYGTRSEAIARLEPLDDGSQAFVLVLDANEAQLERLRLSADAAHALGTRVRELERHAHQLDVFAWSVSHDLRAPLRAVDGFARIVLEDYAAQLAPAAREHLQRVVSASARMERMIDALMALARSTTQPMQRTPVDLGRLAHDIMRNLLRSDPAREAQMHCEPSLVVEGDPDLLRLMLQNLLGNAWKYTSKRAVASIRFDAAADARGRTVYCVSDNGIGFDSANADRLFSPFQRLHPEEDIPGTGIGLAIVQQIVQRHGGTIRAESKPGEGSRFLFTIGG
ncbi:MAG: ATP-binding protein [Burkholderiaceae bacterium]|nr:ATP-binding protein [Burkholderiaceae bacterium]